MITANATQHDITACVRLCPPCMRLPPGHTRAISSLLTGRQHTMTDAICKHRNFEPESRHNSRLLRPICNSVACVQVTDYYALRRAVPTGEDNRIQTITSAITA
jgi:hypothetical protein